MEIADHIAVPIFSHEEKVKEAQGDFLVVSGRSFPI